MIVKTLQEIKDEVLVMIDSSFQIEVKKSSVVPGIDSINLTFDKLTEKYKKTVELETCVLFIDIRKSTEISGSHHNKTLAKLYSAFVRSMVKSASVFGGHVRNIVGDRVMVVFDEDKCIYNAVSTAILLNTVAKFIINKHFDKNTIECGIGVDHGKFLVVKTGTIKVGENNREYKSLVWLGDTANVASKLTDAANKEINKITYELEYWHHPINFLNLPSFIFDDTVRVIKTVVDENEFNKNIGFRVNKLSGNQNEITFKGGGIINAVKKIEKLKTAPILITNRVFDKYEKEHSQEVDIINKWWAKYNSITNLEGVMEYGADVHWDAINKIK